MCVREGEREIEHTNADAPCAVYSYTRPFTVRFCVCKGVCVCEREREHTNADAPCAVYSYTRPFNVRFCVCEKFRDSDGPSILQINLGVCVQARESPSPYLISLSFILVII